jgi:hypothetical protein
MGAGTWLMNAALSNLRQTGRQKTYAKGRTTHIATYKGNVMFNFTRLAGITNCRGHFMRCERELSGEPEAGNLSAATQSDRLLYLADLLSELQALVQPDCLATLEGLLALSQAEARRLAKAAAG